MTEIRLMFVLFILLLVVVGLRFFVLLYRLKNQEENNGHWHVEEWLDEEYRRRKNYFED